ncbi:MAG: methyltransferase domain-containing protein [Planctomycetes bacterium]|nr:methyltransferase domain-containing protein [Planctomycetota bacterium]MBI3844019.1 methyltransferase domain-containing protein [Planctomycetota bacterium]
MKPIAFAFLWLTLPALLAWQTTTAPPPAQHEPSVRPGVNDEYMKDPDVAKWKARFEKEGREIWDRRDEIVERLALKPGESVADIGAGTGFFSFLFSKRVGEKGTVFAVDILPEFIDAIRKDAAARGLANVKPILCKADSTELPPASIDVAFVCDTYHHFEFPKSTLASILAALKPDGRLVVVDFARVPGESKQWVLDHVRVGKDQVIQEIVASGFEKVDDVDFSKETYFLRFKKSAKRSGRRRPTIIPRVGARSRRRF